MKQTKYRKLKPLIMGFLTVAVGVICTSSVISCANNNDQAVNDKTYQSYAFLNNANVSKQANEEIASNNWINLFKEASNDKQSFTNDINNDVAFIFNQTNLAYEAFNNEVIKNGVQNNENYNLPPNYQNSYARLNLQTNQNNLIFSTPPKYNLQYSSQGPITEIAQKEFVPLNTFCDEFYNSTFNPMPQKFSPRNETDQGIMIKSSMKYEGYYLFISKHLSNLNISFDIGSSTSTSSRQNGMYDLYQNTISQTIVANHVNLTYDVVYDIGFYNQNNQNVANSIATVPYTFSNLEISPNLVDFQNKIFAGWSLLSTSNKYGNSQSWFQSNVIYSSNTKSSKYNFLPLDVNQLEVDNLFSVVKQNCNFSNNINSNSSVSIGNVNILPTVVINSNSYSNSALSFIWTANNGIYYPNLSSNYNNYSNNSYYIKTEITTKDIHYGE